MEQEAEEVKREVAYYKKIAEQTGDLFLRETQELSKLISVVKKTETALRENEVKLRNIIEHSNELFYLHDTNYQLTYISPQCIDFFGYTPDEMKVMWAELMTDNPLNRTGSEPTETAIRTGTRQKPYIIEKRKKDGRVILLEIDESPILDENGRVTAIAGAARDVTKREQMESDLRQAYKMEAIGTMTAGIAHDFNNILGIILGNIELALVDDTEGDSVRPNLKAIKSACLKGRDVVRQLVGFSRKNEQSKKPVKIDAILRESVALIRSTLPSSIQINLAISGNTEPVNADPTQIQQVVFNLCTNAAHAMENDGGILTISLEEVKLSENTFPGNRNIQKGKFVKLTVSDTGHGIEPQYKEKIFDPYFTTKEVGKGSGMGLTVVQGIVKNHDGAVSVISEPGKGTSVTSLFPVCPEKPVEEKSSSTELPPGNERVLFVDDEEFIVDISRQILGRLGYRVKACMSPAEALALYQSTPDQFDLVISDMTMPRMNGIELSKRLKEINRRIPIIICTGYSSMVNENKAKELGVDAYIKKPITMQSIAQTIRRVLDNRQV